MLITLFWIASFTKCFTQTSYCLPIEKARLLVADAMKSQVQDSLIVEQSAKIQLLENEKAKTFESLNQIIIIEKEKVQLQSEQSDHYRQLSVTYEDENKRLKKEVRKARWQLRGAVLIGVTLIVLSVL